VKKYISYAVTKETAHQINKTIFILINKIATEDKKLEFSEKITRAL